MRCIACDTPLTTHKRWQSIETVREIDLPEEEENLCTDCLSTVTDCYPMLDNLTPEELELSCREEFHKQPYTLEEELGVSFE